MEFENSLAFATSLDKKDPLKEFRNRFIIPQRNGEEQIYFLGNSLGLQPKTTPAYIQQVLDQWSNYGVEGFFRGEQTWLSYHDQLTGPLSKIVGAQPHEVVVMNQLTINLHLMMVTFYQPKGKRNKILCEAKAFPSDQYMFETHVRHYGLDPNEIIIEVAPRNDEHTIRIEDILETIDRHKDELALVLWGGVNYYSGQLFDISAITKAAHKAGAMVGFDLAHAIGNVPLSLHAWDVDFACWCTYKYLNSGPGAVGGVYIHERFHDQTSLPRLAGWWGYQKETRFRMEKGFIPISSAEGWGVSTPSMIMFACHKAALEIFDEAGMDRILEKGKLLNEYLHYKLGSVNNGLIEVITPSTENDKGNQVSMLMLKDGKRVFDELFVNGIFSDWREPNVIRIAPVPLYNTFSEVWRFGNVLEKIIANI